MTGERQSAETALSAALDEAIRLTAGAGNGTATRSRPIEEWRRLDRLFRKARAALPASTESTGAADPFREYAEHKRGCHVLMPWDASCTCGLDALLSGAASGGVPAALDVDLHAADMATWLVERYIWQQPVLSGTEPPSRENTSDALATIRTVLARCRYRDARLDR